MKSEETNDKKAAHRQQKLWNLASILASMLAFFCVLGLLFEIASYRDLKLELNKMAAKPKPEISWEDDFSAQSTASVVTEQEKTETVRPTAEKYVVNVKTKKIHQATCRYAKEAKQENVKVISAGEVDKYIADGYDYCKVCFKNSPA